MLGTKRVLADRQSIAKERRGLRVRCAPEKIAAGPIQKVGPVGDLQTSVKVRRPLSEHMWRESGAQGPPLRISEGIFLLGINHQEPCHYARYGAPRYTFRLRPRSR